MFVFACIGAVDPAVADVVTAVSTPGFLTFFFKESWACCKIKEDCLAVGGSRPGRKPSLEKDANLKALSLSYSTMSSRDYLPRMRQVLRKE